MLGTRYEEYMELTEEPPFVFHPGIDRSRYNMSTEANWHENLEIQICIAGTGYVLLDGERYDIYPGDIVVVNSNVIHYTGTDSEILYDCLIIDPNFCRRMNLDIVPLVFESCFTDDGIAGRLGQIKEIRTQLNDPCRIAQLNLYLLEILIQLRKNHICSVHKLHEKRNEYETVRSAIHFIRSNYTEKLTLDLIARHVYTDKYRLAHAFKALTGQTVVSYINSHRCRKAAEMISAGMTVSEAAHACGFGNLSYFSKTFQNCMGIMPSQQRQR
ncbi:MAG: helix-turn-helix transcriptional regulator [Clostridia bacterium]|nr:helix-turn-helix transcriptional regulator [Clostridia bacterium]